MPIKTDSGGAGYFGGGSSTPVQRPPPGSSTVTSMAEKTRLPNKTLLQIYTDREDKSHSAAATIALVTLIALYGDEVSAALKVYNAQVSDPDTIKKARDARVTPRELVTLLATSMLTERFDSTPIEAVDAIIKQDGPTAEFVRGIRAGSVDDDWLQARIAQGRDWSAWTGPLFTIVARVAPHLLRELAEYLLGLAKEMKAKVAIPAYLEVDQVNSTAAKVNLIASAKTNVVSRLPDIYAADTAVSLPLHIVDYGTAV